MIILCLGATTNSYPIAFDLKPYYHINVLPTRQLIQPVKPNITLNIIFYQKSLLLVIVTMRRLSQKCH